MFGGLVTMVNGHMTCGLSGRRDERGSDAGLMLRVGANRYEEALRDPYCRKMEFTGKPMTGFVSIDAEGLAEDEDLRRWLALALSFVLAQPSQVGRLSPVAPWILVWGCIACRLRPFPSEAHHVRIQ